MISSAPRHAAAGVRKAAPTSIMTAQNGLQIGTAGDDSTSFGMLQKSAQQLMTDLDSLIDSQHAAAEAAEAEAQAVIDRLKAIPAAKPWLTSALRNRKYGQTPSPWADGNLSGQAALLQADRKLAGWLAAKSGHSLPAPDYDSQANQEKLYASIRSMESETARLREKNQALLQRQRHEQTYGRWTREGRLV